MLKMSPFLTFLLYCLFVSFTIYYLTKDKLDEKSRYILIAVLILPYVFMDQADSFTNIVKENMETFTPVNRESFTPENQIINPDQPTITKIDQPKIVLNQNEKVENLKALEEINTKRRLAEEENIRRKVEEEENIRRRKLEEENSKKTFTLEEVQKLLKSQENKNKNIIVENYGSVYDGNVKPSYNEDASFTNQALKPLGQNGNGFTNEWDHDYILLNTDKWAPALNPPPVCKTEKTCPVCPNLTTGYPTMLREFDSTRRITAPIKANTPSMNA